VGRFLGLYKSGFKVFVMGVLAVFLVGCTTESKVKSLALEKAQVDYEARLQNELKSRVSEDHPLFKDFFIFLKNQVTYEVESLSGGGTQYLAVIQVRTPKEIARLDLQKVVAQLRPHQYSRFNFGNALELIRAQHSGDFHQKIHLKIPVHLEN
jgi:hypothetical protein